VDSLAAARSALKALHTIRQAQRQRRSASGWDAAEEAAKDASLDDERQWDDLRGVAKLGFSWEATDVRRCAPLHVAAAVATGEEEVAVAVAAFWRTWRLRVSRGLAWRAD
jgi:hypothetical protein